MNRRHFIKIAGAAGATTMILDSSACKPQPTPKSQQANVAERIAAMPKAEIHVHLEGALSPGTVWEMAVRNKVRLPAKTLEEWQRYYAFRDFPHFIKVYTQAAACIQRPEDYVQMVEHFCAYQASQHIRYSEVFLSTCLHLKKLPQAALWDALGEGKKIGEAKHGVRLQFIPDISRELPDLQTKVLDFALEGKERGLAIGIGLGGLEAQFPPHLFSATFIEARRHGLHVLAHAGEAAGPESIHAALSELGAERIGHGIRCLEDPSLVKDLRNSQIPIEVCPVSNYATGVLKPGVPHPIRAMFDAGLKCTVNSDDPEMFNTSLTQQYHFLREQGFSWGELQKLNAETLDATFLDEEEKSKYRREWNGL